MIPHRYDVSYQVRTAAEYLDIRHGRQSEPGSGCALGPRLDVKRKQACIGQQLILQGCCFKKGDLRGSMPCMGFPVLVQTSPMFTGAVRWQAVPSLCLPSPDSLSVLQADS